jgi:hypothetical protein
LNPKSKLWKEQQSTMERGVPLEIVTSFLKNKPKIKELKIAT